jgi:hypothetical protein
MKTQGEQLAATYLQAVQRFIATVEGCTEAQWAALTADEGWTVAAVAHHIAANLLGTAGAVQLIVNGVPMPSMGFAEIDAANAREAEEFAFCGKGEVLDQARRDAPAVAGILRGLSDEQYERTGTVPALDDRSVTAAEMAEMAVLGHVQDHLRSILGALEGAAAP